MLGFFAPYEKWALKRLMPLKTVEIDGQKFRYLRSDAPPHDPRRFTPGIEFHQLLSGLTGQVAIDIGANIGSYTLPLARKFEDVTAFEPSETHNKILRMNISLNGLRNVHVYQIALSDVTGEVPLYLRRGGAASLSPEHYGLAYDDVSIAKTAKLDDFLPKFSRLDFMKIDAEGFELQILHGGVGLISRLRPTIALEVHRAKVGPNELCRCEVCDELRTLMYKVQVTGESSSVGHVHWVLAAPRTDA